MIMNTTIRKFTYFLTACLLGCLTGHAYEQDNWYLHGPIDGNLTGVFHQEYNATAKKDMLYKTVAGVGLEVRDINGSLLQTINTGGITFTDIEYDQNTSRLFGINASKLTCYEQNSSGGWSEQWRSTQAVTTMAQGPSGKLFCANNGNKFYVFEQNGTISKEFGWVDGIDSLSNTAKVIGFAPSGTLVASGQFTQTGGSNNRVSLFYFNSNGDYLRHINNQDHDGYLNVSKISPSGMVYVRSDSTNYWGGHLIYHPDGSTVPDPDVQVYVWLQNGDFIWSNKLYRRTFRTKMETNHNSVPQPVIHRIAQRTGTNVMELDFEVIDTDDDNVTVGILAYCGSDKLVPQAWLNGSGSKIGTPIATNTVHSMEWDVKQDWNTSTGAIKFEILCQDGSRDKPVDLHFLKLPFADGNMTISRSPLKEADFVNYAKFLLATGQADINKSSNKIEANSVVDNSFTYNFSSTGKVGRLGPTISELNSTYLGTSLEGNVTMSTNGVQEWIVPQTGTYIFDVAGARGGNGGLGALPGFGARIICKINLTQAQKLKIVVGQKGQDGAGFGQGGGGGGASWVWEDNASTPLLVAGGGAGGTGHSGPRGFDGSFGRSGFSSTDDVLGGKNGSFGTTSSNGDGGGGGVGWVTQSSNAKAGKKFQGGDSDRDGGFGGGGGTKRGSGGGGGYSGGAGSNGYHEAGGGGGSFCSVDQNIFLVHDESNQGFVRIKKVVSANPLVVEGLRVLSDLSFNTTASLKYKLLEQLGYRWATQEEVTKAREAATPGGVNNWTATNQVKPRNLPGKVNEYGFDVSTTEGLWVIKE